MLSLSKQTVVYNCVYTDNLTMLMTSDIQGIHSKTKEKQKSIST